MQNNKMDSDEEEPQRYHDSPSQEPEVDLRQQSDVSPITKSEEQSSKYSGSPLAANVLKEQPEVSVPQDK